MKKPKPKTPPRANGKATVAMFKQLKQTQIEDVRVLMKAVPQMIAARAHPASARERETLEEKIRHCKDRIRFCYWLYTDAVALLGPKPEWLAAE